MQGNYIIARQKALGELLGALYWISVCPVWLCYGYLCAVMALWLY